MFLVSDTCFLKTDTSNQNNKRTPWLHFPFFGGVYCPQIPQWINTDTDIRFFLFLALKRFVVSSVLMKTSKFKNWHSPFIADEPLWSWLAPDVCFFFLALLSFSMGGHCAAWTHSGRILVCGQTDMQGAGVCCSGAVLVPTPQSSTV